MDEVKKRRSSKAGTITRRVRELQNLIDIAADKLEITDKINNVKYAMDELGIVQDEYALLAEAEEDNAKLLATIEKWYDEYDKTASRAIREARQYQSTLEEAKKNGILNYRSWKYRSSNPNRRNFTSGEVYLSD